MSSGRFRKVALALPGAVEGAHQGHADFRVGKRIFATIGYPDDDWGMIKLTPEQQSVLVEAEPEIFRPMPGGDDAAKRAHHGVAEHRAEIERRTARQEQALIQFRAGETRWKSALNRVPA